VGRAGTALNPFGEKAERYEKGEKLDPYLPALWIKRNITHAIAEYLYEKGVVNGYESGDFGPDNMVTRAEAAKIIAGSFNLGHDGDYSVEFDDVQSDPYLAFSGTSLVTLGAGSELTISGNGTVILDDATTINLTDKSQVTLTDSAILTVAEDGVAVIAKNPIDAKKYAFFYLAEYDVEWIDLRPRISKNVNIDYS